MKIKKSKIQNTRNIQSAELAFDAPVTVVVGANGSGKSTSQDSIRTTLFGTINRTEKCRFVSKFDPDSKPKVELELTLNGTGAPANLIRTLTDETGTWAQGGKTTRAKGRALQQVQEHLPISATAADLLLCGNHANFSMLLEEFPDDVQSLLTAATVRGNGPDPKEAIGNLESDFKSAKSKSKKTPGILVSLSEKVQALEAEMVEIEQSNEQLKQLKKSYKIKTSEKTQLLKEVQSTEKKLADLKHASKEMRAILDAQSQLDSLNEQQGAWSTVENRIQREKRSTAALRSDIEQLESQYRVKKRSELQEQLADWQQKSDSAVTISARIEKLQNQLDEKVRPGAEDESQLQKTESKVESLKSKMEATGLNYSLVSLAGKQTVQISQEGGSLEQLSISAEKPVKGIVGNVSVQWGDVRFDAEGKEDISVLKREIKSLNVQRRNLLQRFAVEDTLSFTKLARERTKLESQLLEVRNELRVVLGDQSIDQLQHKVSKTSSAIVGLAVTSADERAVERRVLPPSSELETKIAVKQTEFEAAAVNVRSLEAQQPSEQQISDALQNIATVTGSLNVARSSFEGSACNLVPSRDSYDEIEKQTVTLTSVLDKLKISLGDTEKELVRMQAELEYSGKFRPIDEVQNELGDAEADLEKQELRQRARPFLIQRIEEKLSELASGIPSSLAQSVNKYLGQLSSGCLSGIELNDDLTVRSLQQHSSPLIDWSSSELSTGERTLTALSMRIAIALSLAEHSGSAFLMLDDSFVSLDPVHRAATEALLEELAEDGRIQVILFTCHSDWAEQWSKSASPEVGFIQIADACDYFGNTAAMAVTS